MCIRDSRHDMESAPHHVHLLLASEKLMYENTKRFEIFLRVLNLNIGLTNVKFGNNKINLNEIKSFEDEFEEELKRSHPKITEWKIMKTKIIQSQISDVNKKEITSLYRYFDDQETEISTKFDLIGLAFSVNDFDRVKEMLEKIVDVHELSFNQHCRWYSQMFNLLMSRRDLNGAENILPSLKNLLHEQNAPRKIFKRDIYKIMKARYLNSVGKHLEALNTIEKCFSINHQKIIDFVDTKFLILMKLQRFKEAREILPSDERCKKSSRRLIYLAYYKFINNKFDEIKEMVDHLDVLYVFPYLIEIYSMAKKQFEAQREKLSNEKKMEIVDNLHLLHTWICLEFDNLIIF